jgi:heptosyltransferase-2
MPEYRKILLIQTAFLGDAILTTPLVKALHETYPQSVLDILLIPETAIVYKYNPYIRQTLIFEKRKLFNRCLSFFSVLRKIRAQKYELAVSAQLSFTSSLFMYWGGIKHRLGFPRQKLTTMTVELPKGIPVHKRYLQLMTALTANKFSAQTELYWDEATEKQVNDLYRNNFTAEEIVIGIAPGSVWPTKRWLPEYYAEVIKQLHNRGYKTILVGGKEDYKLCHSIALDSGMPTLNLAGGLSVLGSACLIKKLQLLISNDSAPLHLANAVQTDVIAIFGPTVKSFGFSPFRQRDKVIEVELNCRPCGKHGHTACPQQHFSCMKNIKPETVLNAVYELLEQN